MPIVDLLSLTTQPIRPFQSIPIIDISGLSGDADSKAKVASEIQDACIHVGFFYVKNHGIDENVITSATNASRRFFDLSLEEKMKVGIIQLIGYGHTLGGADMFPPKLDFHKTTNFKGYFPLSGKKYFYECFAIGSEVGASRSASADSMGGLNVWPSEDIVPGFQEIVLKYYQQVAELGSKLLLAFALALNLPEDYFADKVHTGGADMNLMHYLPQNEAVNSTSGEPGIGAHTDFDCFTILWQDEVPALQVKNMADQWIDAGPISGTFVINIADQLSRWSNDIFKSTVHRAINTSQDHRYSIPLFFRLNDDVIIEVLPSCISESRAARYEPILAGDYTKARMEKLYGRLKGSQ
ncbi:unnamed protein product [Rhizoctonia solani]|uniref:Fe2OG dioxygenase domain-containing protein n=1 Tax=Rhizoctonia solani TaxID=456999 RepID=A0A8H2WI55_9AGAM|nr:unnamed protein product [Rhizoctonia solani]